MATYFTIKRWLYTVALKALAERLKKNPSRFDCHDQTAYVKDRFICETDRLISDIIETSDVFNVDGFFSDDGYWKGLRFIKSLFSSCCT